MRRASWVWMGGVWLALGSGCRPAREAPGAPDAAALVDAPADAGVLTPFALDLALSLPDGGTERHALLGLELPRVTPARSLVIEANRPLRNARLRVLDEQDRALASDDVPEELPGGWRDVITLVAPLEPGHRYAVLLDPQSGATLDDGLGHELPEQRLEFETTGERERAKPTAPARRKRHRH